MVDPTTKVYDAVLRALIIEIKVTGSIENHFILVGVVTDDPETNPGSSIQPGWEAHFQIHIHTYATYYHSAYQCAFERFVETGQLKQRTCRHSYEMWNFIQTEHRSGSKQEPRSNSMAATHCGTISFAANPFKIFLIV